MRVISLCMRVCVIAVINLKQNEIKTEVSKVKLLANRLNHRIFPFALHLLCLCVCSDGKIRSKKKRKSNVKMENSWLKFSLMVFLYCIIFCWCIYKNLVRIFSGFEGFVLPLLLLSLIVIVLVLLILCQQRCESVHE